MYLRSDLPDDPPRVGLIAERVEEQLLANNLPTAPLVGTLFQAIEEGGDIEEVKGLDYSRLAVLLIGAVND